MLSLKKLDFENIYQNEQIRGRWRNQLLNRQWNFCHYLEIAFRTYTLRCDCISNLNNSSANLIHCTPQDYVAKFKQCVSQQD
jgi:hypothetical protein